MSNFNSLWYILPEMILAGTAIGLLLLSAFAGNKASRLRWIYPIIALAGVVGALMVLHGIMPGSFQNQSLFFGMLAVDPLSVFFRTLVMLAVLLCVALSAGSPSLPGDRQGEYHALLLILAMGMSLLVASTHMLMIVVSLETVSLCSYLLAGWDSARQRSREAGLKYVLFGGSASGIMLFGMSLLYGLTGSLEIQDLHKAFSTAEIFTTGGGQAATVVALLMIIGGFAFKIAAVPFHMWCPDVYEGAPTPFTALLSVGPKAAGFALFLRFFWGLFLTPGSLGSPLGISDVIPWLTVLGVMSAITMTWGNFAALPQNNLKRLLAYSSIAHAGYLLMGVTAGGIRGFESVAVYLVVYLAMNMGAFAIVESISRKLGSEDIDAFRNLGKREPLLAVTMSVFLISLAGLPPTAGFIGKFYLFAALIQEGGFWIWVLAVVGIFNSVVSLYYYARILKAMYFEKPQNPLTEIPGANAVPAVSLALVLAAVTLLLGIFWQPLAEAARWSANMLQ